MSIYKYIADNNPDGCIAILYKYGYMNNPINSTDDLAYVCQVMVASEGENSLNDLLKIHPDRNLIIEDYNNNSNISVPKENCNCKKDKNNEDSKMVGTDGSTSVSNNTGIVTQTNTFILLGAVLVAVAILTASK